MTRRFADGARLDFTDMSFAELLAWPLAQKAGESLAVPPERIGAATGKEVGDA
ncbi:MAG: hypothetical protein JO007_18240 [Alphaproteobacteria bacterium]|nr:hypothetical protein [Alphaproteobacteria bacterium]